MDFDEVREYVPGDEVRTIDWNVTARAGRPFVKKFTEERELTLLLMVDVSASGDFGSGAQSKRELAAEIASVLAFSAIRNSDKVGLVLFSDQIELYIPPRKGRRHVLRIVREMLGFEPQRRGTDLVQRARLRERRHQPPRDRVPALRLPDRPPELGGASDLRRALRQTNAATISWRCRSRTPASRRCRTSASSPSRTPRPANSSNWTRAIPPCGSASPRSRTTAPCSSGAP